MRTFLTLASVAYLPLLLSCGSSDPGKPYAESTASRSRPRAERSYRFTYETTIPAKPDAKIVDVWLPLPAQDPGVQEVVDLLIDAPNGYRTTSDPLYGNRMLYVQLESPAEPVTISWTAEIRRFEDSGQGALPIQERYLMPTRLVPVDGPALEHAKRLDVTGTSAPLRERAKRIYDDVLGDMKYDKSHEGWGQGSFEHATTVCMGNCTDFHSRFIGVGRAAGIPVRFTMGIPLKPQPKGTYDSYHCWAHYYDGKNWHPVDISEADKVVDDDPGRADWFFGNLDPDRLSLTVGRDLWLEPRQQAGPLNYFVFPYAEADGKPIAMDEEDWVFRYEDLGS